MMSPSSSNKKIKEMSIDPINALPDSILCYILSFLEMKDAAITCLLSKRWQFLWTKLPGIIFEEDYKEDCSFEMEEILKFVNRVHKTLLIYSRNNLERFEVDFMSSYSLHFASDVNVWIGFAVENKVKNVSLMLNTDSNHMLPQMMYSNPSWTSLTLQGCIVAPRGTIQWQSLTSLALQGCIVAPLGTIQWQSLTTLFIREVHLNEHIFEKIFSGCPVLSSLDLVMCWGFNRLEVNSPSLHQLDIYDWNNKHELEISASNLHNLKICLGSRSLFLKNIKSLVTADINIAKCEIEGAKYANSVKKLFESTRHVKKLKLGCDCIQFLSRNALNWQLPQSTREGLELNAYYNNKCTPGILGLLESSPDLQTFVIHFDRPWENISTEMASKDDLDCDLCHLKTVCFKLSGYPYFTTSEIEPMLTLARLLLKKAVVLEKMVVRAPRTTSSSNTAFYKMTQELLSYPRFSQRAVVLLC